MKRSEGVPVYIITGFLDSGKTRFINDMLSDDGFSEGERTLILRCEEGEVEYDEEILKNSNSIVRDIASADEMDEVLEKLDKELLPERVVIEYNAVWTINRLYDAPKPEEWELAQIVTLIDSTTFDMYITNMRNIMADGLNEADLVLFNRCTENTPKSQYRRRVKAMNNSARVYFEALDGTTDDGVSDEDLPYDMSKDPVDILDVDFGIWYLDALEHPDRYDGKRLHMLGQAMYMNGMPNKCYVFSRQAMTCCAADIGGIGFLCKAKGELPKKGQYIDAIVKAEKAFSQLHRRDAIILVQESYKLADKPKEELVYFN